MSQLSYAQGEGGVPLSSLTMGGLIDQAAQRFPDRPAVISAHQSQTLSFSQLKAAVHATSRALVANDIGAGDRVGIWSTNRIEWIILQFAVARIGAILVHINPAYREDELDYTLGHSGCKALFLQTGFRNFDCIGSARLVNARQPQLRWLVHFDNVAQSGALAWEDFLKPERIGTRPDDRSDAAAALATQTERLAQSVKSTDAASIQYTSGTTGRPKGATLTHANMVNNGTQVGARVGLTDDDRICLPVPMFHCYGSVIGVIGAFAHGASVVFPGEGFDPEQCLNAMAASACTAFYGVPMMFIAILNHPSFESYQLRTMRTGLMGGAPCPSEVLKAAMEKMHMGQLGVVYGMTETSPISLQSLPTDTVEQRANSVGRPHPHLALKIIDPADGHTVERGTPGELCVKGYSVMQGYWHQPEATAAAIDPEGWMHSGDLAVMRDDGCVAVVGRMKDMLIRAGENVYPREIEEFLHGLPEVADAQVFGVPDPLYGEQVAAWIKLRPGQQMDETALRSACHGKIASYKVPYYVRFVEGYPVTASGKVQKFKMRATEIADRGLSA